MDVAFDMETSDPDDVFTLCFLAGHPAVSLRAVTVTPGSKQQIGVVKEVLRRLELNIPVGSRKKDHPKSCVSEFHFKWLGQTGEAEPDGEGHEVLASTLRDHPGLKIVTGAPLGNVGSLIELHAPTIDGIVVQGGFAGDSVTDSRDRLEKFAGRETAPTFNLNGDVKSALSILAYAGFGVRMFVSKNVCHGVVYNREMHERMTEARDVSAGIKMMIDGMEEYLKHHPNGKIFHDPLAACVLIDTDVCKFREVEIYRQKGEWGSRLKDGTNTFISVSVDKQRFERILSGQGGGGRTVSSP